MLVTLLVLWLVVIPALTVLGTYAMSGFVARRAAAGRARVLWGPNGDQLAPRSHRHATPRSRSHARRLGGHAAVGR